MNKYKEIENLAINSSNENIVKEFQKLLDQIKIQIDNSPSNSEHIKNNFRLKQLTSALEIIKKYPYKILSGNDLQEIKGIGKGTINRINEILQTGKLSEIKINKKELNISKYIDELMKLHGIGKKTAYNFIVKYGIKSIDQLKKAYDDNIIILNYTIKIALKYYKKYEQNIPRTEMDLHNEYLQKKAYAINKNLLITICGSYRRLKSMSNDIDVLITHTKIKTKLQLKEQNNYLFNFINALKNDKYLLDDLTDKNYEIKYMGYCKLIKYPVRRIDLRYISYNSYFSALIYFTGSANFNKKIRLLAGQLGYLLNEYGLYKLNDNKKIRIKITSEKDIFDKLGLEYLVPELRI